MFLVKKYSWNYCYIKKINKYLVKIVVESVINNKMIKKYIYKYYSCELYYCTLDYY